MTEVQAQTTTSTTEVPRVVGEHPGTLPVVGAGAALLVVIGVAGAYLSRRTKRAEAAARGR